MEEEDPNYLVISADGINDFYRDVLDSIIDRGYDISPRGLPTKEIRPVMVIIKNPRERFLTCPGRLLNSFFQVSESLWILGGRGDVDFIEYYLKNIVKYADGKEEFNAPYGTRMRYWNDNRDIIYNFDNWSRDQFADCYYALRKDPNTRQAAMVFWNPMFDHYGVETNDRPCNIAMVFLIRDNKLDFTIFNRSNDLSWGLANTNVVQFSVILETMAMLLRIPIGNQIHFINSLHAYDFQGEITKRVLVAPYSFNVYEHVKPLPFDMLMPSDNPVMDLDRELELFFEAEREIRKGDVDFIYDEITFFYLRDALTLAKSLYFFKAGKYRLSVQALKDLNADDIFVTVMEFVARKADMADVIPVCMERLNEIDHDSFDEIIKYIREH